jgi:hypothetical protein
MESAVSAFTIACWSFTTVVTIYNVFSLWGLFPRSRKSKSKLREAALQNVKEADRTDFDKVMDQSIIEGTKSAESLRVFVRFIKDYQAVDLNVLITRIRFGRARLQTAILPTRLTADQVAIWSKFNSIMKEFWNGGKSKDVIKKRNEVGRIALYAMSHLDQADDIYQLVERRRVYRLKDVKALLKEIDDSPSGALSDGAL